MTEDFIATNQSNLNWSKISADQKLSEDFMEEFSDKIDWINISSHQKLSQSFIRRHWDKVDWLFIASYQVLSEDFIEEFSDKLNWNLIAKYQVLSEAFIERHSDDLSLPYVVNYQKLSKKFRDDHKLVVSDDCWLYKSSEFKKNFIIKNSLTTKVSGDHLIAYKAVRKEGNYSLFSFHNQYKKGIYTAHCDCNISNHRSNGLSAFFKKADALSAYDLDVKVIRVKISLEDIGAIIKPKILRTSRLEVL